MLPRTILISSAFATISEELRPLLGAIRRRVHGNIHIVIRALNIEMSEGV
jgi:hypothetical protein